MSYVVPPDVGWVDDDGESGVEVAVAALPDGPPVALHGSSALIWLAAADGGDDAAVVTRVAEQTGEHPDAVRSAVIAFLAELVGLGLLGQSSSSSSR